MHRLTYLSAHLNNGKLMRWPEQCFPIPIFIAPCRWYTFSESDKYAYKNMVIDALKIWEKAIGGNFSFNIVNDINASQIDVSWRRVDRKSLGSCTFLKDNEQRLCSAEVTIGISDGIIHKQYMDENEVFHTILHEIGHALGLGHSTNSEDIMYTPHKYGLVSLSKRDINSIRWLYKLPYEASCESLNALYSLNYTNIDDIIMHIASSKTESTFHKVLNNTHIKFRNLEDEQDKLAQMKKFQMSIQNIKLPKDIADKFKDM